jgi:NAD(P)H-nitrite reductase large subunit
MIGAEEPGPVDRPNLSKDYLAGKAPEEWALLGDAGHYKEIGVELVANDPVLTLDLAQRSVHLKSGRWLSFDKLLLATGAEPNRLGIPGSELAHVLTLRSLADSKAIIERATPGATALVVGASFIGLEVAAALRQRGVVVHVVAPDAVPLGAILGPELGSLVKRLHEEKGVVFHLGRKPAAIDQKSVTLDNGVVIEAELVVFGVGVKPRTSIAEKAGLKVDNGVVVNEHMEASEPGVYAAGDIARYPDVGGELLRVEHWVVAERQGQAAARAMLGGLDPFRKAPFFWSAHYDLVINYLGAGAGWERLEIKGNLDARDALVVYYRGERVVAVAAIGRDLELLRIEAALETGDQARLKAIVGGA